MTLNEDEILQMRMGRAVDFMLAGRERKSDERKGL